MRLVVTAEVNITDEDAQDMKDEFGTDDVRSINSYDLADYFMQAGACTITDARIRG